MGRWHGVRRVAGGGVRVRLSSHEREVLAALPAQLRPILAGEADAPGATGSARDRLFPPAYDDPAAEREFRELIGTSVVEERLAAVAAFAETLAGGSTGPWGWSTMLSDEHAHAWLGATNDARLLLAEVAGITAEDQWQHDADGPLHALLHYLSWLQEELLAALTSAL